MNIITARRYAGAGCAFLVSRPRGVAHAYTGPLTRSRTAVPAGRRPLCGTRTRRLRLVDTPAGARRVCVRCARHLTQATAGPVDRNTVARRWSHVTAWDLVCELEAAATPGEVDEVAHLSLLLVGGVDCLHTPVTAPDGRRVDPLHQHVMRHRRRVAEARPDRITESLNEATRKRIAERRAAREYRQGDIDRLGMSLATTT